MVFQSCMLYYLFVYGFGVKLHPFVLDIGGEAGTIPVMFDIRSLCFKWNRVYIKNGRMGE
jgi:hypothetical protein